MSKILALCLAGLVAPCFACGSDEATIEDDTEEMGGGNPMREGPAGCYIGAEMRCDCEVEEGDCGDDNGGTWVPDGCASCAE